MNENFKLLGGLLGADVDDAALIDALYILRVPRSLVGIIPAVRQFRDWLGKYKPLAQLPDLPDYQRRLDILERIANLDANSDQLTGRSTAKHHDKWTPLRPFTGDSVICELLLIRAGEGTDATSFEHVSAWLLWQAQRFHLKTISRSAYEQYLVTHERRLHEQAHGSRLYGSYLALRRLAAAEPGVQDNLKALAGLTSDISAERSLELTLLAQIGHLSATSRVRGRLCRYALEGLNYDEQELLDSSRHVAELLQPEMVLLLRTVWGEQLERKAGFRHVHRKPRGRTVHRPQIHRSERLTEMLLRTDEDAVHSGTVVEFFPWDGDGFESVRVGDEDEDDPEEEDQGEPAVSLFLADDVDLIKGYYAAKGIQNAIEYQNAQLHWNKWTLSRAALKAVLVSNSVGNGEDILDRSARLAIGLSLLTGRSLEEVATPLVATGQASTNDKTPVAISVGEHRLHIRTGAPHLRRPSAQIQPFCYPTCDELSLPLPVDWRPLIGAIGAGKQKARAAIARRARQRLHGLPNELQVTEKGVRDAFVRALAERTRGDLGAQKAICDGAEANSRNIIHYASYDVRQLQTWWREAVETLVGPLSADDQKPQLEARVGAQHAFDLRKLAIYFKEVKTRLVQAETSKDWPRAFNLMTLYLSYWLGLGVAGRRSLSPVPHVFLDDGWVLVADKRRSDGSTDRLVPLTDALRRQIESYAAFASELSIMVPQLDPVVDTGNGSQIRLQYIHRTQGVVPYQPKYQEQDEQLTPLPANWGRKVVRSESAKFPGRYRDAELGHWVRGRHAWDATSTFPAGDFRKRWLQLQNELESRLGFGVVEMASCRETSWQLPRSPAEKRPRKVVVEKPELSTSEAGTLDIENLLRSASPSRFDALQNPREPCDPSVVLELVRRAVRSQKNKPVEWQRIVAEKACVYVRETRKIPLYAVRPRPLFSNRTVLAGHALQILSYLQHHVLGRFQADLELLPPRQQACCQKEVTEQRGIELGRLAMIAIWRLGLTRWALIESWLHELHMGSPILATGTHRYMIVRVKSPSSRESMRRTVFLDCFSSSYLVVERQVIRDSLLPSLFSRTSASRRRADIQACIWAYLRYLGVAQHKVTLADMTGAATQWIMLKSAPIIAAYARGELVTEDLGDRELRRLTKLEPARRSGALVEKGPPATRELDLGESDLPNNVLKHVPVMKVLGRHSSPYKSEWRRRIRQHKPSSPLESLLCSFALWLLDHSDPQAGGARISEHRKRHHKGRIRVIAYALLGYTANEPGWQVIDGDTLSTLQEISSDQFPDRLQHGAWFHFHRYLLDAKADHAGFQVGKLGPPPERSISAKILSGYELRTIQSVLMSARSGIGNAALRVSAKHHVELMTTFGMRRSESAYLRSVDFQGDLFRVQAYGLHGLKTPWADRVLPTGFAAPVTRDWVREAHHQGFEKLIDPAADTPAVPDNFFDALSRLVKAVTHDESMGSHHLRHTLISRLVLTLLRDSTGLDELFENLPWLKDLMIGQEKMNALLGREGDAGQGMRAVAALVGHSHPTTTLRHYVHVLCIALYGTLRKMDTLDMSRSFENRIGGKSTVQRWNAGVRVGVVESAVQGEQRQRINQGLRDRIERRFKWIGVDHDETPRAASDFKIDCLEPSVVVDTISFDKLELVDRSLRDGHYLLGASEVETYRDGLRQLAGIESGKRGSVRARHMLMQVRSGVWLPPRLASGMATRAAVTLCEWLESLREFNPQTFQWLLAKWAYASERERGRMKLDEPGEVERALQLADPYRVRIEVNGAVVSKKRSGSNTASVSRMRIKCVGSDGQLLTRDTIAVRWVLTYVAARWRDPES